MKYKIPNLILENLNNLKSVVLYIKHNNSTANLIKLNISPSVDWIFVPSKFLNDLVLVRFDVKLESGEIFNIVAEQYAEQAPPVKKSLTRRIYSSNYDNTPEDKNIILELLNPIITQTNSLNNDLIGEKNLICYTCFKTDEYLDLLVLSVKSIVARGFFSGDFLIITQPNFKPIIEEKLQNLNLNLFFHLIDEPENGVIASTYKLNIFDYENIDDYKAILFLDCDIIACKNPDDIFSYINEVDCISTAFNPAVNVNAHRSKFHSLDYPADPILESIDENTFIPFNAGQFLVKNSIRSKSHFENMIWFLHNWPGKIFFEQAIMNRYFLQAGALDQKLSEYVFLNTANSLNKEGLNLLDEKVALIHFASVSLNGAAKLININKFKIETSL
jgi:hypothetical protein